MDKNVTKEKLTQMYLTLKKEAEEKIRKLEVSESHAHNRAKGFMESLQITEDKYKELELLLKENDPNAVSVIIRKKILIEKLKTGFVRKEFTGERTSVKMKVEGKFSLDKDVSGEYISTEAEIAECAIASTLNLLSSDGVGGKIGIDIRVVRL